MISSLFAKYWYTDPFEMPAASAMAFVLQPVYPLARKT